MKGAISSGSIATSEAGAFALENGGNAIDAMIASQLAAHVCEPMLTGFGGAGLATIRHQGVVHLIDMFTTMPGLGRRSLDHKMDEVVLDFGSTSQTFTIGEGSISVPTVPQGLTLIHKRFGTLPMEVLAQPAVKLCQVGFTVSKSCAYLLNLLNPIIKRSSVLSKWYSSNNGRILQEGDVCRPIEMQRDIEHFLMYGEEFFTSGIVYESIKTLHNSLISKIDLTRYNPKMSLSQPLKKEGTSIHLHGLPSSGRNIIEGMNPWDIKTPIDTIEALSAAYLKFNKEANQHATQLKSLGNTTHISVIDEQQNAASITTSLGETSGIVLPNTGVAMNNFLGETDVAHPILTQNPGNRLLTMCAPVIVESDGNLLAMGSGGSSRIPGAIFQVLSNILKGHSISEAIQASRVHTQCTDQLLEIFHEPLAIEYVEEIKRQYSHSPVNSFPESNLFFGGVHVAGLQNGKIVGAADKRRSGATVLV